jgi:hypothetical protein
MYRRPKFLEILLEIREQMSRDVDYDVDLFAEMVRSGKISEDERKFKLDVGKHAPNNSVNRRKAAE